MKKLLIALLLISVGDIFAQDFEPLPVSFIWGNVTTPRPFDPNAFKQTQFFTGFQWGSTYNMDNVLMNNAVALGTYKSATSKKFNPPINLIIQPRWINNSGYQIITSANQIINKSVHLHIN